MLNKIGYFEPVGVHQAFIVGCALMLDTPHIDAAGKWGAQSGLFAPNRLDEIMHTAKIAAV